MQNLCNKEKTCLDYSIMFHCMVLGNNTTNLNPRRSILIPVFHPKWNLQAEGNKDIFLKHTLPAYSKVSSLKDIQKRYDLLREWYGYFSFRKDFRPSYGKLATIGSILPQVPLLGLTATATKKTRPDIIESLGMVNAVEKLGNHACQIFIFHHPLDQTEERIN